MHLCVVVLQPPNRARPRRVCTSFWLSRLGCRRSDVTAKPQYVPYSGMYRPVWADMLELFAQIGEQTLHLFGVEHGGCPGAAPERHRAPASTQVSHRQKNGDWGLYGLV